MSITQIILSTTSAGVGLAGLIAAWSMFQDASRYDLTPALLGLLSISVSTMSFLLAYLIHVGDFVS